MTEKKERYYFSHDYNARNDDKVEAMISDHGAAGYGLYWCLVERLHEESNQISLSENFYKAIAKQMLSKPEQVKRFVEDCCTQYGLFENTAGILSAKRVKDNLSRREEISEKRRLAGKSGAIAKQMLASAKQNQAKERKGKEIKGKENNINTGVAVATTKNLLDRKNEFAVQLDAYIGQYGRTTIDDFFRYWSEADKKGRMKFELQKTWEIPLRLATWYKRQNGFTKPNGFKKGVFVA